MPTQPFQRPQTQAERLWECHRHAHALCINGFYLNNIISPNPNWEKVAEIMSPIRNATQWLLNNRLAGWEALRLYDGLRPDAVSWGISGFRSWHAAMFEGLVYDGSNFQLPVWWGTAQNGSWVIAPYRDWNLADDAKTREAAWARICFMAPPRTSSNGKVAPRLTQTDPIWKTVDDWSTHDDAVESCCNIFGWSNIAFCDPLFLVPNLEAEYAYAIRNTGKLPEDNWSRYLQVKEWHTVLGTETRDGASRQLNQWAEEGKAQKRPTRENEPQSRDWRVRLGALTEKQREEMAKLEETKIKRASANSTKKIK